MKSFIFVGAGVESIRAQQVIAIMGAQWGDEGKGKLVDVLGADYDIIARCAGGSNAGTGHSFNVLFFG